MTLKFSALSDQELADEAQIGVRGQGAIVESNRRLRLTIERLDAQTAWQNGMMLWLNIAMTALALVGVVLTGLQVYIAFR